ncbi:Uncharacterised protein [Mycobacteroides abscessus]|nr:Uncharacterised protein [Mycobacteroides abscessus]
MISVADSTGMRTARTSSSSVRASRSSSIGSPTIRYRTSMSSPPWYALKSQFSVGSVISSPASRSTSRARSTSTSRIAKSASWLGSGAPRAHAA